MEYQQAQMATTQYAGVGIRFLAHLIDGIIIGAVGGVITGPIMATHSPTLTSITSSILVILGFLYFAVLEAIQGATVGKMVLGLRVVKTDGSSPIGWGPSIIRNLLRIIDALFIYLVGAILIWTSPLKQRLGDRLADTIVVRTR